MDFCTKNKFYNRRKLRLGLKLDLIGVVLQAVQGAFFVYMALL